MNGFIIVDKPSGLTSHDVVNFVRKKLGIRKVGHAGTLDPIATGVLVILVGKATKLFLRFEGFDKEYEATLTLGKTTSSGDAQGKIIKESPYGHISREQVEEIFLQFMGETEQVPPMVSAIKYQGRRLYKLARKGLDVPRKARKIKIHESKISEFELPNINFYVRCSKGTYIRKLGEDIGNRLGVGAYISRIRRVGLGPFNIKEAIRIEDIDESHIRSWKY